MRRIFTLLIPALTVLLVWLVWPFFLSAGGQVERVQQKLVSQAEKRNWLEAKKFLAADFEDQWGHNRNDVIELATAAFEGTLYLNIDWTTAEVTENENIVKVRGTAKMNGSGGGATPLIIKKVNELTEPWVFTWTKEGWKPSDWKLLSMKNAALENVAFPEGF